MKTQLGDQDEHHDRLWMFSCSQYLALISVLCLYTRWPERQLRPGRGGLGEPRSPPEDQTSCPKRTSSETSTAAQTGEPSGQAVGSWRRKDGWYETKARFFFKWGAWSLREQSAILPGQETSSEGHVSQQGRYDDLSFCSSVAKKKTFLYLS